MIHDLLIRNRRRPASPLASAQCALRRLSAAGPWVWLVRSGALETAPALGLVLLDGLSGLVDTLGAGAFGHG